MVTVTHERVCRKCGTARPLNEFRPNKRSGDGRQHICSTCLPNVFRRGLPLADAFAAKVDTEGPIHPVLGTRCHLWAGSQKAGYGLLWTCARNQQAHRVAWELKHGKIPPGMCVLHRCDNKLCVREDGHLFLGTNADNVADKVAKGRCARMAGALNPSAKIDATQAAEIRARHARGETQRSLAISYDVAPSTIWYVVTGKHWAAA